MTYYSPKSPGRPEEVPWSIAREGKGGGSQPKLFHIFFMTSLTPIGTKKQSVKNWP